MATKTKMTPEEKKEHLDKISFSNLVKEIDEKWGHTYQEYVPTKDDDLEDWFENREN